jgi:N-acetyl-D-muramate 6-phosphate phosphatase
MTRFRHLKAVLFDLDGTLIDSAPDMGAATNTLRERRGMAPLPLSEYRSRAGSGARGMLAAGFGLAPGEAGFDALKDEFFLAYDDCMLERTGPFADTVPVLVTLRQRGLAWGVVTNKSTRYTVPLARAFAWLGEADTLISGDTTAHTKPHPAPLLEAASRLGIAPAECLYVGDDARDVIAGRAAGMWTVAANYGYLGEPADTAQWGADATINSLTELLQLLPQA